MPKINGKIALVTGASSGIGKSTVQKLIAEGATVYAAARRMDRMKELEEAGAKLVSLDITDEKSVSRAVSGVLEKEGSIDILVNNAGYGSYGAIEDVSLTEARRQFEVNIFGLAHLTQLILPKMRENQYGKIINISSMGGKVYTPFGGWYHATKHALEGLTDCLRLETKQFGINPIVIEPGGIATEWGSIAAENLKKTSGSGAYGKSALKAADGMAKMYQSGMLSKPEVISNVIIKAVKARNPKTRYAAGFGAKLSIFIRNTFGDKVFDRVAMMMA